VLLRVVGCLLLLAALAAAWFGAGEQEDMKGQVATIRAREGERGKRLSVKKANEQIADAEAAIEGMTQRMYLWYGAAAACLVVGALLLLLPSRGRRKVPAAELPPS
jgi:hypothetical protein